MKSSVLLAEALHKKLTAADFDDNMPLEQVYDRIGRAYDIVYRLINLYYNPHSISFAEAGALFSVEHKDHEKAMAAGHYILAGDFFEEDSGKYLDFLELLASRENFIGYRNVVISRSEFKTDSCGVPREQIFPELA